MRLTLIPPLILALTGCYDFAGDRARLGFSTDATIDGSRKWTPESPLADGTRPQIAVGEILATGSEPSGPARFEGSRSVSLTSGEDVFLSGSGKGWVGAEVDGVRDDFTVRWAQAESGVFLDPIADAAGLPSELDALVLVEGGRTPVRYVLHDKRGLELGYVFDQVRVRTTGPTLAVSDEGLVLDGTEPGVHEITAAWPGARPTTLSVEVVTADAIDGIALERLQVADQCVLHAVLLHGDRRVDGGTGFTWSHADSAEPFAPCERGVEVQWSRLGFGERA